MTAKGHHGFNTMSSRRRLASALFVASVVRSCAFQVMAPSGISSIDERIIGKKNTTPNMIARNRLHHFRKSMELFYHDREDDMMEDFIDGVRYEMVDLPDSMVDTTVFVGNLCEFVTDDMLSALFQQASTLNFVPACIVRKPNCSSMKYGFVAFPTIAEKEAAIIRFTRYLLNDRPMRVESIVDYRYRVRVPENLVLYTVGASKKTRDGSKNTMRMAQNSRDMLKPKRERTRVKKNNLSGESALEASHTQDRLKGKKKKIQRRKDRKRDKIDPTIWT